MIGKKFVYYDLILVAFVMALLISNLVATKLIAFGSIITDGGAILFPLTYIIDDVLTEVYGYKYARRAIWTGFVMMIVAIGVFTAVRYMPAAPEYTNQSAYEAVLGYFPRIVAASLAAYLTGSFINSFILAKLKVKMAGKKMWVRLIGSTFVGELLDTTVFGLVAFYGILHGSDMIKFILIGWIFKTSVEIILLPVSYRVINFLKKVEHVDHYDKKTDFTPFKFNV